MVIVTSCEREDAKAFRNVSSVEVWRRGVWSHGRVYTDQDHCGWQGRPEVVATTTYTGADVDDFDVQNDPKWGWLMMG